MVIIYHDITLDFAENDSLLTVPIVQGDNGGRAVRVSFTYNGVSVSVGSAGGDYAELFASVNGTATALGTYCPIIDTMWCGAVLIPITSALSAIAGKEHCEIRITSASGVVHTADFILDVQPIAATSDMPYVVETADIVKDVSDIRTALGGLSLRRMTSTSFPLIEHDPYTVYYVVQTDGSVKHYLGDTEISGGAAPAPAASAGEAIHQLDGGTYTIAGHAEPITE